MKKPPARLIELKRVEFKSATGSADLDPLPPQPAQSARLPRPLNPHERERVFILFTTHEESVRRIARKRGFSEPDVEDAIRERYATQLARETYKAFQRARAAAFPLRKVA